jgi:molybdopterin synthase sulfur carrier subunit|tara:strand:- start:5161 stop:5415 length:255 start_codon:yes stop_codon:yes gene_type:complete
MIKIKYFARLGEALQLREEDLALNGAILTVSDLLGLLRNRGEPWASQFSSKNSVLMALNHEMCDSIATLKSGDEVGFFPPVTGG